MQIQTLYKSINSWILLIFLMGCSSQPTPPKISLDKAPGTPQAKIFTTSDMAIPQPCKGIKIVGELTPLEFEKFFQCLNQKGGLEGLKPFVLGNPENTALLTKLYNENFGNNPKTRLETLDLIHRLDENKGLSDLLKLLSLFITDFIDAQDFDQTIKPLLTDILSDDIDLLQLLKSVVTYRDFGKLQGLIKDTIRDDRLVDNLNSLSTFLKYVDADGQKGSQNFITFLKNALELSKSSFSRNFNSEDAYQLTRAEIPRSFLKTLYDLKEKEKLPTLLHLLSDLSHRSTATVLTKERLQALSDLHAPLTPQQRESSLKVLKSHPANDLSAIVKLTSSLHRGFVADETGESRDLLNSLDKFLQDVKASLDAHPKLGPDADASRRMTTYRIYVNLAHQELMDPAFHDLPSNEEKFSFYTTEDGQNTYSAFIKMYKTQKPIHESKREEARLRALEPPLSEDEIQQHLKEFRKNFQKELPALVTAYRDFLNQEVKEALYFINDYPLLLGSKTYDLLNTLKNTKSMSLVAMQALMNLKNESLHTLIEQLISKLKEFHEFNHPVEEFMRSVEEDSIADSTWLHHTVDPILYFMGKDVPLKDRMTLMAFVQSYQAVERLLLTENRLWEIKDILLPFIENICNANQEERILDLIQFLHSGNFFLDPEEKNRDPDHESKELITQISPLLIPMLDSGFFENTLNFMAAFGNPDSQAAETSNQFLKFLLQSQEVSQKRPIDPLVETLKNLSQKHPQALVQFLDHLAQFLTPETTQQLKSFFLKYEKLSRSESILTEMIKRDEMKPFLNTMKQMLDQNTFRSTHHFMKQLIESGQLEESLRLLVKLLMASASGG